ncbi:TPA: DUF4007 family protein [Pseudomonas aeruginosa]|uniref:DUF4007 family protein n=1 Tax=Pseudomonas aeruginosa TaxID=287 RepID=UPI00229C6B4F|nr:DUF4007 family protein [Pseudomonas aeruginosa]HCF2752377.1 DUF4007 family protein [Pseudomonas aeruginosa]HCF6369473.1 DUF4007 family protein [Pseudomonas aeruginosa]HCW1144962.1 DUF4007 family protein [Pseudomonas aeruginosa]
MTSTQNDRTDAHFSGHETFPLRQMWLKKAVDRADPNGRVSKDTFSDEQAIADFGVGRNMVASIKHWALACDVMAEDESRRHFVLTPAGKQIFRESGLDPYSENPVTAWYAHWCLAGRGTRSTTWFWLFNIFSAQLFSREEALPTLTKYALSVAGGRKLSQATLSRDLDTCLRGYAPRSASSSVEEAAEPMLAELGLLHEERKGVFSFRRGPKSTLPDAFFAWALLDYWMRYRRAESSLTFETAAYAQGSPGRVFKLDEESVAERLFSLADLTGGKLRWSDTSGLRQVHRSDFDPELLMTELLRESYGE